MGLTRITAQQISNIDYKQSVRVVTVSNITLSGGAPATVDGVSLSAGDRVLVTAQSTESQNGIYYVQTVGVGSNGTWVRTNDANTSGEIEAGMIIMVTEGANYADTQWKLTTNDPITVDSTSLTFVQNYSTSSISSGSSNVAVVANGNVTISSAGTSNVLTVTSSGANIAGTISATGNVTGNYILGNGALLTGVITSVANINNGTSNVTVVSSGGNVTVGIGGYSNVAVFGTNSLSLGGPFATPKTINSNVLIANAVNAVLISPVTIGALGNIFVPTDSTLTIFTPA